MYEDITKTEDSKIQNKLLKDIAKQQALLEYYECYQAENILFNIIEQMHIDPALLDLKVSQLSGGEKSKVAFAHLLYSKPEIILLDEPTNHLDTTTREYIINYLKNYKGTILVISHDIDFLDKVVNKIMHIDKVTHQFTVYDGNYTTFKKKEKALKEAKNRLIQKQEKEEQQLKEFILQYSNSSGKRKRIAQSREKLLVKKQKEKIERDQQYKKVKLNLQPNREGSKIPLKINNISYHYPNQKDIFHDLSFTINNQERFLIVGKNGVGKSTLLKLITQNLKPSEGNIWLGNKTDIAYYAQEQENLDNTKTILENIDQRQYSEKELRTILGSFLFHGDDVFKKISVLSPGEKARVSLCKVMMQKGNLLILDEPTNHLDPETQQILGENFKNYKGSIILVSHNPSFVKSIGIDRMLILPKGKINNFDEETLNYYYQTNTKE